MCSVSHTTKILKNLDTILQCHKVIVPKVMNLTCQVDINHGIPGIKYPFLD